MIEIILGISILSNVFLGWYGYSLLKDRIDLVEIFKNFSIVVKDYEEHLSVLNKMDIYYGEPTIMALIEHTGDIRQRLDELLKSVEIEESVDDKKE